MFSINNANDAFYTLIGSDLCVGDFQCVETFVSVHLHRHASVLPRLQRLAVLKPRHFRFRFSYNNKAASLAYYDVMTSITILQYSVAFAYRKGNYFTKMTT